MEVDDLTEIKAWQMQNVWLIIIKKVYDSYTNIDYILLLLWLYTLGMNRKILSDYEIGFPF